MSNSGNTGSPAGKNYYSNNTSSSKAVPPGEQFTTPAGSPGYTLSDIYVQTGNGSGNGIGSSTSWTLFVYSISGSSAALVASYSGLTTGTTFNNGDWLHFGGLSLALSGNSEYAYAIYSGSTAYTGLENSTTPLTGANAILIATNLSSGVGSTTAVTGFNGVFDAALTPSSVALSEQSSNPTPGANDISQLGNTGNNSNPAGNSYYSNNHSGSNPLSPGEEFTTGNNAGGYDLTNLFVQVDNSSGNSIGSYTPWTLSVYSVSGSTATLLASYTGPVIGASFVNNDWLNFSGFSIPLMPNTTYAFTLGTEDNRTLLGGSGPYTSLEDSTTALAGGMAVLVNAGSGAVTGITGYNAVFDAGLSLVSGPGTPTGLTATPGNNQVTLAWSAPGGVVTGYNVYRSTTSGTNYSVLAAGADISGSPFTDSTAVNGTTYYYVVTALNGALEGGYSAQAGATPPRANEAVVWNGIQAGDNNWTSGTTDTNWLGTSTTFFENGDSAVFNDNSSSGAQSVSLNSSVSPGSLSFATTNVTYTVSGAGAIVGSTGLTNVGPGSLILAESGGDAFSGGINVRGGTLTLDNANAAMSGGAIISTGAVLQVGNNDGQGTMPSGNVINNAQIILDHGGATTVSNAISGPGSLDQMGGDQVLLTGSSSFTGSVLVTNNSTLQAGNDSAFGTAGGSVIIANGSTVDENGYYSDAVGSRSYFVQGAGVGGNGALVNNNGYGDLLQVTLTGDATLGGSQRFDLTGQLSTGGQPFNLSIVGSSYHEWSNLSVDTNLANLTLGGTCTLGDKGTTALGNPTNTLEIQSGATLVFYNNGSANVTLDKSLLVDDGGVVENGGGANQIISPVTLGSGYCTFNVGGTSLAINGPLSGSGILYMNTGNSTLTVNGNSPQFSGGALIYAGGLVIDGNFGSGPVTCETGTTLSGTGTVGGLVDVYGALLPGNGGAAGTFTAGGGLILESGATLTNGLGATVMGGNDQVAVTGNLTVNNNTIVLKQLGGTLQNGIYPLITYTGTLIGSFAGIQTASPSVYALTLTNITTATPNEIAVIVSGTPSALSWNNGSGNNQWDVLSSFNWTNLSDHTEEQFASADIVTFDDSITNASVPGTNVNIVAGQIVSPAVITNNSTVSYTFSGAGEIGGAAAIVKSGAGTLTLQTTNSFTGNVSILGGTVRAWGPGGLGATNGTVTISNGATLDRGWSGVGPVIVSGSGVGGNGAVVNNSGGNAIYDGSGGMTPSLTLAGNTTFGGNTRWDIGGPAGAVLSTGGSNYQIVVSEAAGTYMEWDNLTIDTNLGNIDVYTTGGGSLGIKGCGLGLGNPTNTITVHTNSELTFWGETTNNSGYAKNIHVMTGGDVAFRPQNPNIYYNSTLILDAGAEMDFLNGSGNGTVLFGTVTLNGLVHFEVGDSTVTFSNVLSGPGGFYWDNYNNTLVFTAENTYQGITDIRAGRTLSLAGNGSILDSAEISLAAGATLMVSNRVDGTLTLAGGQTLLGGGSVAGNLAASSGSTVAPGATNATGVLSVTGNATLNGTTLIKLNSTTNDVLSVGATVNYGGTLALTNISATPLAAGDSFQLFHASAFGGSFAAISPAIPGAGLAWNTAGLANGVLSVVSSGPARVTGISVSGVTLTLTATNGSANGPFVLLGTTNLALPLPLWTPVLTNSFDDNGNLDLSTNVINPAYRQEYFILAQP